MVAFMYLHGLLSSSHSTKGTMLKERLKEFGEVYNPDFYPIGTQWEFEKMTLSYLLEKVNTWIEYTEEQVILIGSAFGGLVATRFIQTNYESKKHVVGLILLAPAFNYSNVLESHIKPQDWQLWQKKGFLPVKHPAWKNATNLSWEFVKDLKQNHSSIDFPINIPILLVHSNADKEIPIENSKHFVASQQSLGTVIEEYYLVNGEHNLLDTFDLVMQHILIWLAKQRFIK